MKRRIPILLLAISLLSGCGQAQSTASNNSSCLTFTTYDEKRNIVESDNGVEPDIEIDPSLYYDRAALNAKLAESEAK